VPAVATAQQAPPDSGPQLGEVVITAARKTREDLQRAAITVTTIGPQEIARSGFNDPTDLQWNTPAVESQSATSIPALSIRGGAAGLTSQRRNNLSALESRCANLLS
jgi:outer membrane cobalamin receptor